MSHFTVLVIGDDPEKQLAPYDENIEVPEYRARYDDDQLARWRGEGWSDRKIAGYYCNADNHYRDGDFQEIADCTGCGVDDEGPWHYSTYNPKSKWDWYSIGGRWAGTLILREGAMPITKSDPGLQHHMGEAEMPDPFKRTDQALHRDVDWSAMEHDGYENAKQRWEKYQNTEAFSRILAGILPGDTEDSFVQRESRWQTYAVVKDGVWYERGQMGWWGLASNEKSTDQWDEEFAKLISDLSPDTLLTVVDCHI